MMSFRTLTLNGPKSKVARAPEPPPNIAGLGDKEWGLAKQLRGSNPSIGRDIDGN